MSSAVNDRCLTPLPHAQCILVPSSFIPPPFAICCPHTHPRPLPHVLSPSPPHYRRVVRKFDNSTLSLTQSLHTKIVSEIPSTSDRALGMWIVEGAWLAQLAASPTRAEGCRCMATTHGIKVLIPWVVWWQPRYTSRHKQ